MCLYIYMYAHMIYGESQTLNLYFAATTTTGQRPGKIWPGQRPSPT